MAIDKSLYQDRFDKALDHLQRELTSLRTGRASVQLLDGVRVMAYGASMAIHEVANVSAPDAQLLVVKPWDKSLLGEIEKAIQVAQLNLNPVVDGEIIRIPVPPLTKERRQEMVKTLHQKVEEAKIMLRTIRSDVRRDIEDQEGEAGISEDDIKLELNELEEVVKDYIERADSVSANKEKELLSI